MNPAIASLQSRFIYVSKKKDPLLAGLPIILLPPLEYPGRTA